MSAAGLTARKYLHKMHVIFRVYAKRTRQLTGGCVVSHAILPELVETAADAFGRSWTFIQHDPLLAGCDRSQLKAELAREILAHADGDDVDPVRLANRAIGSLREKIVGRRFGLVRRPDMGRQSWTAAPWVPSGQHAAGQTA
jgi:hypothetical protein